MMATVEERLELAERIGYCKSVSQWIVTAADHHWIIRALDQQIAGEKLKRIEREAA